jgi:hypothetical protein
MMIVSDRVHVKDVPDYSMTLLDQHTLSMQVPATHYPWRKQRKLIVAAAVKNGIMKDDRSCEDLKIQLNSMIDNKNRAKREIRLHFPPDHFLDNNVFTPEASTSDDVVKKDLFQFTKQVELAPNFQLPLTETFLVWKIAVEEEEVRKVDQVTDTSDADLLTRAFQGANLTEEEQDGIGDD